MRTNFQSGVLVRIEGYGPTFSPEFGLIEEFGRTAHREPRTAYGIQDRFATGQLYAAVGSIGANLGEGYSRSSGRIARAFSSTRWDQSEKA